MVRRLVFEEYIGPTDKQITTTCENPLCVSPKHLIERNTRSVTHQQYIRQHVLSAIEELALTLIRAGIEPRTDESVQYLIQTLHQHDLLDASQLSNKIRSEKVHL
jgi:hypothetical protein